LELTWFETTIVRATSIFSEYNNTILYHKQYRNYQKYIYYHLKHPFYLLNRVFLSFFDSYLGNFKSRSTMFQNIFWLVYKCSFLIWTLFFLIDNLVLYDFEVACFIFTIPLTTSLVQLLASSPRVMCIVGSSRGRVKPMARKWYFLLLG
jgi:hypothetical protein